MKNIVTYFRVSTREQGESGLGLEAQEAAVTTFAKGQKARILGNYTEVESGRRNDRLELARAIGHAKRSQATLVVAKIDRLSRNVAFLSKLMDSGVEFVACDNPYANRLTIHILAAVAEDEARRASDRTKKALAAYKKRGGKLGSHLPQCNQLTQEHRRKGAARSGEIAAQLAQEAYRDIAPLIRELRQQGLSLQKIARRLDALGHTTRRGRPWNPVQVTKVLMMDL